MISMIGNMCIAVSAMITLTERHNEMRMINALVLNFAALMCARTPVRVCICILYMIMQYIVLVKMDKKEEE